MTVPRASQTLALDRPIPLVLVRGVATVLYWPLRYGSGGDLVEPVEAGSEVTITRANGTLLLDGGPLSVVSSVAQVSVAAGSTEDLGDSYSAEVTVALSDGDPWRAREQVIVLQHLPPCTVSERTLFDAVAELRHRVPQAQGPRGSGVGWQPQIDNAYHTLIRKLLGWGREPWKIADSVGAHEWLLAEAVKNCLTAIGGGADSWTAQASKDWAFLRRDAEAGLRFVMHEGTPGVRQAAAPTIRLAPLRSW